MDAGRGRLTQLFSGAYSYWHCDALLLIPHHGHVLLLPTAGGISPQKGSPTHPARLLLSLGRNVDELLRVFDGLQTADANGVATPANWRPGEAVIVPAPLTQADAEKRAGSKDFEVTDWYLSKKKLAAAAD